MNLCPRCGREFEPASEAHPLCPQCEHEWRAAQAERAPRHLAWLSSPTYLLIAINTVVFIAMAMQARTVFFSDSQLLLRWGANSGALTSGGQWWRLLTSCFVHGGLVHIALNMWCLYNLGWLAELLFGRRRFTLLYLLCGIGGSLGSICWRGNGLSVGASGAIFGLAGALLPAMMLHSNPQLRAALKGQLSSIGMFVVYNLAFGAAVRGIDNAAHIGGLVTGMVLGAAYPTGMDRRVGRGKARALAGTLVVLLAFTAAGKFAQQHNQPYIQTEQASSAYDRGDLNGAIAHAQRAATLKPNDAHAQFMLGTLLMNDKRYADAVAPFTATTRVRPKFGPAYVNLCLAQLELKQLQMALANCERGAELAPADAESWFNLGRVRYELHDLSGARDALAKAVVINPQGFDENLQYALMLIANGESAKAVPYLQKAHNLHPQDEDVTRMLGEAQRTR